MKANFKVLAKFWAYTFGTSLLTVVAYHLVPGFGTFFGDITINCDRVRIPLMSCALLALLVVGLRAYWTRNKPQGDGT